MQHLSGSDPAALVALARAAEAEIEVSPEMFSNGLASFDPDGHSFAVDATGRVIAIGDDAPGLVMATFDLALIRRVRREDAFRWQV